MKRAFLYVAAAVALLTGCAKEKDTPVDVPSAKTYTITAALDEPETRTVTAYEETTNTFKFSWEEGETIAVVPDGFATKLAFDLVNADEGTFSYTDPTGQSEYQTFGLAVTPAKALRDNPAPRVDQYTIDLSGHYDYGKSNAIMIAGAPTSVNGNQKFQFKHAAALVKVTYKNIPAGTTAMVLTSENNITGSVALTATTDVTISTGMLSGTTGTTARVEFASATTDFMETADFYVPIPTGNYQSFTIKLVAGDDTVPGSERTVSVSTPIAVNAADVLMFPETTLPKYYRKVTATDQLVNGTYLIVYEGGSSGEAVALNGALGTIDAVNNGVSVSISDNKILAGDASVDAAAFTIDVAAGTIKSSQGYYIYNSSSSNALTKSQTAPTAQSFSIDTDGNAVMRNHHSKGDTFLRFNSASNQKRFRYYTNGQQPIALYLLEGSATSEPVEVIAAPVFSPAGGSFTSEQEVTITSATSDATIYYTTDGTDPTTSTTTTVANGGTVTVSASCTLKAIAVKDGKASAVTSAEFTITNSVVVGKTVTYTVTSTSAVSVTGDVPSGSSATYSSTYSDKFQLTKNNSMTLTLKGFGGHTITGLTLSMKSNSSSGEGYMYMATKSGSTLSYFATIGPEAAAKPFNDPAWHGAWSTSYVDVTAPVTPTRVGAGEDVVICIAATANSLYCQSFTLTYDGTPSSVGQVVTGGYSDVNSIGATLSATFTGINTSVHPQEAGFYYGFNENELTFKAVSEVEIVDGSGTYSAVANQCAPATTYYYRAYMLVWDPDQGENGAYVEILSSEVRTFTTQASTPIPTNLLELPAYGNDDLVITMYKTGGTSGTPENRNYTFNYSTQYYAAMWVAYTLSSADLGSNSYSKWTFNTAIDNDLQINVCDKSYGTNYGADQYSRGHQIPDADRSGNKDALKQTYLVTNQTPQIQNGFNGTIWARLEEAVRAQTSSTDVLYVVTGPTYQTVGGNESITWLNATSSSIKPETIPVPNYYWKVLLKVKKNDDGDIIGASTIGFWFDHRVYQSSEKYPSFATSVNDIETKTGFDLFVNLPDDYEEAVESNTNWEAFQSF